MSYPKQFKKITSIRTRLQTAFIIITLIAFGAVLSATLSIKETQQQIDSMMNESLPLIFHSQKLDKEAAIFAIAINDFRDITSNQQRQKLVTLFDKQIEEIKNHLTALAALNFEKKNIAILQNQIDVLVSNMNVQNSLAQYAINAHNKLLASTERLELLQQNFITATKPHIDNKYAEIIKKGSEIDNTLEKIADHVNNDDLLYSINRVNNGLRVNIDTLVSSIVGELKANLDIVGLTFWGIATLNNAGKTNDQQELQLLKKNFNQIYLQITKSHLILAHSLPENLKALLLSKSIFQLGKGQNSIFSLQKQKLTLRKSATESVKHARFLSEKITHQINVLLTAGTELTEATKKQLQQDLKRAQLLQIAAGISVLALSIIISWFFLEKNIVTRLSSLQKAMERHANGENAEIKHSGNDEISHMAFALQAFVNERSEIEDKLIKTLSELSGVMDSIDYGIVFMDADLEIQLTNNAFRKMWGLTETIVPERSTLLDLIERNLHKDILPIEKDQLDSLSTLAKNLLQEEHTGTKELKLRNNSIIQYQSIILPNGEKMLTFFDITDLKTAQQKLAQSQKMETIGLMAGGVAHDLNNILSGIVTYPDLLLMHLPEDSSFRKPVEVIKDSGIRAANIVADLLTVARGIAATRKVVDLNAMIRVCLNSPECNNIQQHHPQVVINENFYNNPLHIKCSPVHIEKCIMNLVSNAAEAINREGRIEIKTEIIQSIPDTESSGPFVKLSVKDTGPGISSENIDHIFEPFYTKKEMGRSGTGLGLTIVWNTIQEHNGYVKVISDTEGTVFALFLPLSDKQPEKPPDSVTREDLLGNSETILVVDDENQQLEIADKILTSLHYQVEICSSGEEALELVKKQPFNLIVLDMIMQPGMNGRETYEKILQIKPEQKAILVSGFSENIDVKKARKLGAKIFVKKPYTIEQLGLAVREILS